MSGKTTAATKVGQIIQFISSPHERLFTSKLVHFFIITDSIHSSTWRTSYMHGKKNYTQLHSTICDFADKVSPERGKVRKEIWGGGWGVGV